MIYRREEEEERFYYREEGKGARKKRGKHSKNEKEIENLTDRQKKENNT